MATQNYNITLGLERQKRNSIRNCKKSSLINELSYRFYSFNIEMFIFVTTNSLYNRHVY